MSNFGFSLVEDPGGDKLLREAYVKDVESQSKLIINPGRACLVIIDGKATLYDEEGRYSVYTGLHPFLKGIQNVVSKGKSTHTSRFYFYDTAENVYRNVEFTVSNLICREFETKLQGECSPRVNLAVRIESPDRFFNALLGYEYNNDAISSLMSKQVIPWVRKELFEATKNDPIISVNANACNFSSILESRLRAVMKHLGLKTDTVQITDLGVSSKFQADMEKYHEKNVAAEQEMNIIKKYAKELFDGDVQKAANYVAINKGMGKDVVGFNPIFWNMMKDYIN